MENVVLCLFAFDTKVASKQKETHGPAAPRHELRPVVTEELSVIWTAQAYMELNGYDFIWITEVSFYWSGHLWNVLMGPKNKNQIEKTDTK